MSTEALLLYPEDAPSQVIQREIRLQTPVEARVPPLASVPISAIRGFCYLSDECDADGPVPFTAPTTHRVVVLVDELVGSAVAVTAAPPVAGGGVAEAPHLVWSLELPESPDPAVFIMCLSQMARRFRIIVRGVLQKKSALLLWKRRGYYLLDSFDLIQLSSAAADAPPSVHIPLWHLGVSVARLASSEAPSGCRGVMLRIRRDVDEHGVPASSPAKTVLLACEREDARLWDTVWEPDLLASGTDSPLTSADTTQVTHVSVLRSVLAANRSRYRILIRSERLMEAVREGIPPELRPDFWCVVCNVDGRKASRVSGSPSGSSSYGRLVKFGSSHGSLFRLALEQHLSRADNRTPPAYQAPLRRMLLAFGVWTKLAGQQSVQRYSVSVQLDATNEPLYHPALLALSAALLHHLDEENAFWALTFLSDKLLPQYFSSAQSVGLQIHASVFGELVAHYLPRVAGVLTERRLPPREFALRWLPLCFTCLHPEDVARLGDLSMLSGHGMLFRLSVALLSVSGLPDAPAAAPSADGDVFDDIVQRLRAVDVEVLIAHAFSAREFGDIEKDFVFRRDTLCTEILREVDAVVKVCAQRSEAVECVRLTVVELRDVLLRISMELPGREGDSSDVSFVEAHKRANAEVAAGDPLRESVRLEQHLQSLQGSTDTLLALCHRLATCIHARATALHRVEQVSTTLSKAALAAHAHLGADAHSAASEGVVSPTAAFEKIWFENACAVVLDAPVNEDDSPAALLDAVCAAVWALSSFGFSLVSVSKQVADAVGSFATVSGEAWSASPHLSRQCSLWLGEVHEFASKLCGLVGSLLDSHAPHKFEVRARVPALALSEALVRFQREAPRVTAETARAQATVDRLRRWIV